MSGLSAPDTPDQGKPWTLIEGGMVRTMRTLEDAGEFIPSVLAAKAAIHDGPLQAEFLLRHWSPAAPFEILSELQNVANHRGWPPSRPGRKGGLLSLGVHAIAVA